MEGIFSWEEASKPPANGEDDKLSEKGRKAYDQQQKLVYGDVTQTMLAAARTHETTVEHLLTQNFFNEEEEKAWRRRERALKHSAVYTALVNDLQSSMDATNLTKEQIFEMLETLENDLVEMFIAGVERGEHMQVCMGGIHRMPRYDASTAKVHHTCESTTQQRYYHAASGTIKKEKKRTYYTLGSVLGGCKSAFFVVFQTNNFVNVFNIFSFQYLLLIFFLSILVDESLAFIRRPNCCLGFKDGTGRTTPDQARSAVASVVCLVVSTDKEAGINGKLNQLGGAMEGVGKLDIFPHTILSLFIFTDSSFVSLFLFFIFLYQQALECSNYPKLH